VFLSKSFVSFLPKEINSNITKHFIIFNDSSGRKAYFSGRRIQLLSYSSDYGKGFVEVTEQEAKKKHLGKVRCLGTVTSENELLEILSKYFSFEIVPKDDIKFKEQKKPGKEIKNKLDWYILLVHQGFEETIKEQLLQNQKKLEFKEVYTTEELPGYVFIRSKEIVKRNVSNYLIFDGVLKFLGVQKQGLQKFTTSQIKNLNISEIELKKISPLFKKGDHVVIKKGDLADIDGTIVEISKGKKILKLKPVFFQNFLKNIIIRVKVQDVDFV